MTLADGCFWSDRAGEYVANSPLRGDTPVDIAIVGGGYTGLSAAIDLKRQDPSIRVALLEARCVGEGASGRNAGWLTTLFGFEEPLVMRLHGDTRAREGYRYARDGLAHVEQLIEEYEIDSGYRRSGALRIFTAPAGDALEEVQRRASRLGRADQVEILDAAQVGDRIRSPLFRSGFRDREVGYFDPLAQARGLKAAACSLGAEIYEHSPVIHVDRQAPRVKIATPRGSVSAERVVLATNGYTHLLPRSLSLGRRQLPLFVYLVATEPLSDAQLDELRWAHREPFGIVFPLFYTCNPTADDRLVFGMNYYATVPRGTAMHHAHDPRVVQNASSHLSAFFPALRDVRITHHWGGPISLTLDIVPQLGLLDDERFLYAYGCFGHGVVLAHQHGRTLAELALGIESERTNAWFVTRRKRGFGSLRLGQLGARALIELMQWQTRRQLRSTGVTVPLT